MDINATLLVEMIIFLIFFMVTKHYIWPPIIQALDERKALIDKGLKQADEARQKLEQADKETKSALNKAALEANKIILNAQKEAQSIVNKTKKTCQERLNKLDKELEVQAEQAQKKAQKKIEGEMLAVATKICLKALAGSLDQKTASRLIETQTSTEN